MCGYSFSPKSKGHRPTSKTKSAKEIGNGYLETQIGLEDRNGDAPEEHLRVSSDAEVGNS